MNMQLGWPFQQQPNTYNWTYPTMYSLSFEALEQIRTLIREELYKADHPEEERPSATVEYEQDGKRWRGTVYLVENEEDSWQKNY